MKRSEILKAALTLLNPVEVMDGKPAQRFNYLCHCVSDADIGMGKEVGYAKERSELRQVISEKINHNVDFDMYYREKFGVMLNRITVQTARRKFAEELIAEFEKEENKVSSLLIEAKKLLHGENHVGTTFICHAIAQAAGVDYKGDKTGYTPAAKQATEAVELIVGTGNEHKDDTPIYRKFHNVLTGTDLTYSHNHRATMQAGRHRLLDYLIAEFQAVGN